MLGTERLMLRSLAAGKGTSVPVPPALRIHLTVCLRNRLNFPSRRLAPLMNSAGPSLTRRGRPLLAQRSSSSRWTKLARH